MIKRNRWNVKLKILRMSMWVFRSTSRELDLDPDAFGLCLSGGGTCLEFDSCHSLSFSPLYNVNNMLWVVMNLLVLWVPCSRLSRFVERLLLKSTHARCWNLHIYWFSVNPVLMVCWNLHMSCVEIYTWHGYFGEFEVNLNRKRWDVVILYSLNCN